MALDCIQLSKHTTLAMQEENAVWRHIRIWAGKSFLLWRKSWIKNMTRLRQKGLSSICQGESRQLPSLIWKWISWRSWKILHWCQRLVLTAGIMVCWTEYRKREDFSAICWEYRRIGWLSAEMRVWPWCMTRLRVPWCSVCLEALPGASLTK